MACNRNPDAVNDPSRVNLRLIPVLVLEALGLVLHLRLQRTEALEVFLSDKSHPSGGVVDANQREELPSDRSFKELSWWLVPTDFLETPELALWGFFLAWRSCNRHGRIKPARAPSDLSRGSPSDN